MLEVALDQRDTRFTESYPRCQVQQTQKGIVERAGFIWGTSPNRPPQRSSKQQRAHAEPHNHSQLLRDSVALHLAQRPDQRAPDQRDSSSQTVVPVAKRSGFAYL